MSSRCGLTVDHAVCRVCRVPGSLHVQKPLCKSRERVAAFLETTKGYLFSSKHNSPSFSIGRKGSLLGLSHIFLFLYSILISFLYLNMYDIFAAGCFRKPNINQHKIFKSSLQKLYGRHHDLVNPHGVQCFK